jgi:hypothetical protein
MGYLYLFPLFMIIASLKPNVFVLNGNSTIEAIIYLPNSLLLTMTLK